MLEAALLTFPLIFVAELGDKSALATMSFATRYRPWQVLAAVSLANGVTQGVSVIAGVVAGEVVDGPVLGVLAGLLFLLFAALTLRERGDDAETESASASRSGRGLFAAIAITVIVAEFGDKTMLATIALAAQWSPIGVWLGSFLGMTTTSALAVLAGRFLQQRVSPRRIRIAAAAIFALVGVLLIVDAIR